MAPLNRCWASFRKLLFYSMCQQVAHVNVVYHGIPNYEPSPMTCFNLLVLGVVYGWHWVTIPSTIPLLLVENPKLHRMNVCIICCNIPWISSLPKYCKIIMHRGRWWISLHWGFFRWESRWRPSSRMMAIGTPRMLGRRFSVAFTLIFFWGGTYKYL